MVSPEFRVPGIPPKYGVPRTSPGIGGIRLVSPEFAQPLTRSVKHPLDQDTPLHLRLPVPKQQRVPQLRQEMY